MAVDKGTDYSTLDKSQLGPLCSLDDPTRRRLYEYVAANQRVTRDQASAALEIERPLVAYHLDRLVAEGLLAASFARPGGRGGPGAGRPTKYYERSDREFAVTVPHRNYELVAELLARAADSDSSGVVHQALEAAASTVGTELVSSTESKQPSDLMAFLEARGFEPYRDGDVVRLRNCPFHQLARRHTELICNMNLAMLNAAAEQLDARQVARLDPTPGGCCVSFTLL